MARSDTRTRLLDEALQLVQARGFNAFSFKDLATEIGIKTASIHYHFPSKIDLGEALLERYTGELDVELARIDAQHADALERLEAFISTYQATLRRSAICLCGAFASDLNTLPEALHPPVRRYLEHTLSWVQRTIESGVASGALSPPASARETAAAVVASLQGALIMARGLGGRAAGQQFAQTRRFLLASIAA